MMRHFFVAVLTGLEPATIPQTTGYPTIGRQDLFLSGRQDSNLRPDGPKPPDLPTDLLPEIFSLSDRGRTCGLSIPNAPLYHLSYT
jgi:hypothetical protein